MTLQQRIQDALTYYNCRASHLATASGVSQAIVHRLASGKQDGVNSRTLEKLGPYLDRKMPKDCLEGIGRAPVKKRKPRPGGASKSAFDLP